MRSAAVADADIVAQTVMSETPLRLLRQLLLVLGERLGKLFRDFPFRRKAQFLLGPLVKRGGRFERDLRRDVTQNRIGDVLVQISSPATI